MNCNEDKRSDNDNFNSPDHTVCVTSETDDSALIQCDKDSLKDDDYYETISADGSICGDGTNDSFTNTESDYSHHNNNEQCPYLNLPFVPKLEEVSLSEESSSFVPVLNNTDINTHAKNSPTSGFIKPNFDFSIPPPNYEVFKQKVNAPGCHSDYQLLTSSNHDSKPTSSLVSTCNTLSDNSRPNITKAKESFNPSMLKTPIADWLDDNGDPIKGAFDNIEVNNSAANNASKSSKVEYVFSVKETKSVPISSSYFLNLQKFSDVDNINKINLGLPAEKLKVYEEEKNLYLASKSGDEYKVALQTTTTSLSNPGINKTVAENAKKELLNRFQRNPIADKQSVPQSVSILDVPQTDGPKKTQEEVALESLAVTEILKDIQQGAARAKQHGALGWQKCPVPVTNKTFLRNTLVSTLREPYRPPAKRGRFHVGLEGDKNQSKYYDDNSDSSSSDSGSLRSSRSRLSSRSSCGSSHTSDEDYNERRDRGSLSHDQFYDEWAAYYGYQWYGTEAYNMYYGPEGWPADPYMYYENAQGWHGYNSYYGPQNFNYRGRGLRGRGSGRGWGNQIKDLRECIRLPRSRSRSYSRSSSRSRSETSQIRSETSHNISETSRNRSGTFQSRSEKLHRQQTSRSNSRSLSRSKTNRNDACTSDSKKKSESSRVQSHGPTNVKKNKKKASSKKKKKHKKKSKKKSKYKKSKVDTEEQQREDYFEEAEITDSYSQKDKDVEKNEDSKPKLYKENVKSKKSFDKLQDNETESGQKVIKLISRNSQEKGVKRKKTEVNKSLEKEKLKDDNDMNIKRKDRQLTDDNEVNKKRKDRQLTDDNEVNKKRKDKQLSDENEVNKKRKENENNILLEKKETKASTSVNKTKSVSSDKVGSTKSNVVKGEHSQHSQTYGKRRSPSHDLKSGNAWSKSTRMDNDVAETSKRMKDYYHSNQKETRKLKYQTSNIDNCNLQVAPSDKNSLHSIVSIKVLNISKNSDSKSKMRQKQTEEEVKKVTEKDKRGVQGSKEEKSKLTSANFKKRKSSEEMELTKNKKLKQQLKLHKDKKKETYQNKAENISLCTRDFHDRSFDKVSKKIELSKDTPLISASKSLDITQERSKKRYDKKS